MDFSCIIVPALFVLVGGLIVWLSTQRILSLRRKNSSAWRKITERFILSLVALAAMAVAGNSSYDAAVNLGSSPPGSIYLVDGHKMRIDCMGSGSPTIVLDAGLGNDGLIWSRVQSVLAKTTRVCSYDRAGFGWSDPLPPPRDADHIASELHSLLMAAKVDGSIVLMGHSIAGLYIRDYASRYPASIAGLIFVDGSAPPPSENSAIKGNDVRRPSLGIETISEKGAFYVGFPRLFGACPGSFPGFALRSAMLQLEGLCHEHFEAYASESENFDRSSTEVLHADSYGTLPVLIFSRYTTDRAWNQKQEDLKKLSTRSYRIIARNSGHYIQLDRPELIEKGVQMFIDEIQGTASKPTDYGWTSTQ
jgi:pimeloyl-ACP methyl ester carboxylesterase